MSDEKKKISPRKLQRQVAKYARLKPSYEIYALALKGVLEKACKASFPDAFVQAREKSITSFAEKCVRKFEKYPDAVNQLTDLCGGRVIVQTLEQVKAVKQFIEANFEILEADEKGLLLGDDKFGYRDMHYIVRLIPGRAAGLGFNPGQIKAIGDKRAEIQVRTWVQHAWADTLHDRMYKSKLKYPAEFKRTGALLAAIMEDGDRAFNRLAGDIDGMLANFNAYASNEEVDRELNVQNLILERAEDPKKPEIALNIARLSAARGDYGRVIEVLAPHVRAGASMGDPIRMELGHALCQFHRAAPGHADYRKGQRYLNDVVDHCRKQTMETVPDLRRNVSALARALAWLAWSYSAVDEDAHKARACHREALELEPDNPYYLAEVLGHEIASLGRRDFIGAMASGIRRAIATCRDHIRNGTEMPFAAFTAGRLHLLLGENNPALGYYARGIRHVLSCGACVPPSVFAAEEKWLVLAAKPEALSGGYRWAVDLLRMAASLHGAAPPSKPVSGNRKRLVLVVAGGARSLRPGQAKQLRPMLVEAFRGFTGTIVSGGTRVGVPGCVGDAAAKTGPRGKRPFDLIGYLPHMRPGDDPPDSRYDDSFECGEEGFTSEQILKYWSDILGSGVKPLEVRLLGFGGDELSAAEYRIALGFGAWTGLVEGSGGAADALLKDNLWTGTSNLLSLPFDRASVRAHVHPPQVRPELDSTTVVKMAKAFHAEYVRTSTGRLPDNMKPWEELPDTYQSANLEQAKYAVQILEANGFAVRKVPNGKKPRVFTGFTKQEIERMAEMEHGRWNVERLHQGWRYGEARNDALKRHNNIVPWRLVPDGKQGVKRYDRNAVRQFPAILAQAKLEVRRQGHS